MKNLKKLAAVAAMVLMGTVLSVKAEAAPIVIDPTDATCTDNDTAAANEETNVEACAGGLDMSLYYKSNYEDDPPTALGEDSGPFAAAYTTTFDPTIDPSNALIEYVSGTAISCPTCWLVVKDGNNDPANYYINLGSWNGTDPLSIEGFWEGVNGSISHVSIYGTFTGTTPGGTTPGGQEMPEPASLLLLGTSLVAAGYTARRRKTRS